ncbi:MAG TPA: M48 family metallopeptidase [Gemmataceae bacterium]|nr:M48 family metallopeptidase [Gemmataceae bacterium]
MKWLPFFGSLLLVTLFLVTTFSHSPATRAAAAAHFPDDVIERGLQYSFERRLLSWPLIALRLGLLFLLVESGLGRKLADWCQSLVGGRWLPTVLMVGLLFFLADELLTLPFAIAHFELARAWGLTSRDLADWLVERAKGLGVAMVTDGIVLVGLYTLLRWFPRRWWLAATAAGTLLGIAYAFLAPVVIEPIFNTFTPLERTSWAPLEGMVRSLVERAGVPVNEILVVDASRQGNHSNAYFTGFGATQRIVLYDNLLKSHPPAEVESILAHELGHWRHQHIVKGIALGAVGALMGLFILAQILAMSVGRGRLALRSPADPAGLPLILLMLTIGSWLAMPVGNAISRAFERQADEDSLVLARQPEAFIAAEKRLAIDNIGNVAPLPFSVWLFASHPSAVERIQMAEQWQRRHKLD